MHENSQVAIIVLVVALCSHKPNHGKEVGDSAGASRTESFGLGRVTHSTVDSAVVGLGLQ